MFVLKLFKLTNNGYFTTAPGSPFVHSIIRVQLQYCMALLGSPVGLRRCILSHCFRGAASTTACGNVLWTGSVTDPGYKSLWREKRGISASTKVGWQQATASGMQVETGLGTHCSGIAPGKLFHSVRPVSLVTVQPHYFLASLTDVTCQAKNPQL